MNNKIKHEMNTIEIPKELHERGNRGVQQAKSEMQKNKGFRSKGIALVASLLIVIGGYGVYKYYPTFNNMPIVAVGEGLQIPAIDLPTSNGMADMVGLIVYNGKIYTQTSTKVDPERAKDLLGEKIGETKGNINEWSKQNQYAVELASTIGKVDVFTVKGYDKNFRIMTYAENDGELTAEFFECLNGITLHDGSGVFGELKMAGNSVNAQYRNSSDWNHEVENFHPIDDEDLLNSFVEQLNHTVPYDSENVEAKLGDFRNDENYKEMILNLTDGSTVSLLVLKDGYIRYGSLNLYFKMDNPVFEKMWEQLSSK
ncbi:hypothetical protein [Sporosarcina limicola]|uniref:Uncharacterized protein n=1 Tax=Sporosarcina limicola TaxID=34101 RepID=A0A927R4J0_9BACL|nr:hypothetical protein [Sporosarcina limicola]MBE1556261.1 hypothetical protein [Sporosarcina limicola]